MSTILVVFVDMAENKVTAVTANSQYPHFNKLQNVNNLYANSDDLNEDQEDIISTLSEHIAEMYDNCITPGLVFFNSTDMDKMNSQCFAPSGGIDRIVFTGTY